MNDLNIQGMTVAPNVVETIVSLAARDVEGVAELGTTASGSIRSILGGKQPVPGLEIEVDEDEKLYIVLRMVVKSGYVIPDVAAAVRQSVADAVSMQVGVGVSAVDIFVDGIRFDS